MNERYPVVTDIVASQTTASLLKNLMFSQDGFLTTHLTYMYQSWLISTQDKTLGSYLMKLALNNGDIFDAMGNITIAFGGDPNFMTTNGKNWSTQYLIMSKNREAFLKNAILMENKAVGNLENAIPKVDNVSLKQLLTAIKEDKQNVIKDLTNFLSPTP